MASFLCLEVRKEAQVSPMYCVLWSYRETRLVVEQKKEIKTKALPHCIYSGEPVKGYRWGADENRQQLERRRESSAV